MARKHKSENDLVLSTGAAVPPRHKPARAARSKYSAPPVEQPESSCSEMPSVTAEPVPVSATPKPVSQDEIARLAYSYWEARGRQGGSAEEDWQRAERELSARATGATA